MAADLAKIAKDRKIKYFLISYVDLFGGLRAKLVPAAAIGAMQRDGAGFAGFATWLDMTPAHPDLFAGVHVHLPSFGPLFVLGGCLTLAYEWSGSILVPMTMHALFNFFSLSVFSIVS